MKILELPLPFFTPANVMLPVRDAYGISHGTEYEAFKTARQGMISTRATLRGLKFRRRYEALSQNELRPLLIFSFNPYVVDMRDQYPIYESACFDRAVAQGKRMRTSEVMTIDMLLTIVSPIDGSLHYHGISIKDSRARLDEFDERRRMREQAALEKRNWTFELLRGGEFSNIAYYNYFFLYRNVRETNVFEYYRPARDFSKIVVSSSLRGNLDGIMGRIAKRMGISLDLAYRLFSIATAFGFLTPDNTRRLAVDAPLHLRFLP